MITTIKTVSFVRTPEKLRKGSWEQGILIEGTDVDGRIKQTITDESLNEVLEEPFRIEDAPGFQLSNLTIGRRAVNLFRSPEDSGNIADAISRRTTESFRNAPDDDLTIEHFKD